nr:hypothetical protein [Tanacetum cinerariifolium]
PNGDALRKCILNGPYIPTTVLVQAVAAIDDSLAIFEHTTVETPMNMSPANKAHFEAEKEVIHLILTGIGDEIYSTVDAYQIAQEMWEAIERLQQGKEIAKPITPPYETASEEDSDHEQAQKDKDMQKNLALIAKVKDSAYHKQKMLLCKQADKGVPLQAEQYDWLAETDEKIDEQELEAHYSYMAKIQEVPTADTCTDSEPLEHVQNNTGYNVFANDLQHSEQSESITHNVDTTLWYKNDNQYGQFGNQRTMNIVGDRENECRKPKRVKDFEYHKEKMLLCKQAEKGVPLQAEQYDWLADTDEEIDEQELEAHYSYMAKIQENDQNDVESDDECVALANLIANLKLDVDENKKIQKQLKKANIALAQELK